MKVLVKGIVTGEDAARCVEHGADGILVSEPRRPCRTSRCAARSSRCRRSSPRCAAGSRCSCDSGFRRGTDIFKALALGATAVGVGRPYIWGLGAFGQNGVEKVIDMLTRELRIVMQQMGATSIAKISKSSLRMAHE